MKRLMAAAALVLVAGCALGGGLRFYWDAVGADPECGVVRYELQMDGEEIRSAGTNTVWLWEGAPRYGGHVWTVRGVGDYGPGAWSLPWTNAAGPVPGVMGGFRRVEWVEEELGPELLLNGAFEAFDDGGLAQGWELRGDGASPLSWRREEGREGWAQEIELDLAPGKWGCYLWQAPALVTGMTYEVSGWYWAPMAVRVAVANADFSEVDMEMPLGPTNGWVQFRRRWTRGNGAADRLRLILNESGAARWDGLSLREVR